MSVPQTSERRRGRPKKGAEYDNESMFVAALACFASQGFDGTSLRMIAVKAGVDVALISYRYGSKLGLWTAVIDSVAQDILQRIEAWPQEHRGLPRDQQMRYLSRDLVVLMHKRPLFARTISAELMRPGGSEPTQIITDRLAKPVSQKIDQYLRQLRDNNLESSGLRSQLPLLLALVTIGSAVSLQESLGQLMTSPFQTGEFLTDLENIIIKMLEI